MQYITHTAVITSHHTRFPLCRSARCDTVHLGSTLTLCLLFLSNSSLRPASIISRWKVVWGKWRRRPGWCLSSQQPRLIQEGNFLSLVESEADLHHCKVMSMRFSKVYNAEATHFWSVLVVGAGPRMAYPSCSSSGTRAAGFLSSLQPRKAASTAAYHQNASYTHLIEAKWERVNSSLVDPSAKI